eukprot:INCI17814.2.p1 GENE.INCI17814.2~~INCI17814.2.p1  ORF type:complete len:532 (+),score=133.50 INCI17814.2:327-1922(+)
MQAYLAKKYGAGAAGGGGGDGSRRDSASHRGSRSKKKTKKKQRREPAAAVKIVDADDFVESSSSRASGFGRDGPTDDSWAFMQNPEDAPVVVNAGDLQRLRREQQEDRARLQQRASAKASQEAALAKARAGRARAPASDSDSDLDISRPSPARTRVSHPRSKTSEQPNSDSDLSIGSRNRPQPSGGGSARDAQRPQKRRHRRRRHDSDASSASDSESDGAESSGSASSDVSSSSSDSRHGGRRRRARVGSSGSDSGSDSDLDVGRRGSGTGEKERREQTTVPSAKDAAARALEAAAAAPDKFTGQLTKEQFTAMMKAREARDEAALVASGVDLSASSNATTTFRDSQTGKKIDKVGEYMRDKLKDDKQLTPAQIEAQKREWGKGASQKEAEAAARARLEEAKNLKFSRRAGEEGQDDLLKQQLLPDDPMYKYFQDKADEDDKEADLEDAENTSAAAAALGTANPAAASKRRRRRYRGAVPPPPNRFRNAVQPGYRWDGTDRSNGFEHRLLQAMTSSKIAATAQYKWSVSDM